MRLKLLYQAIQQNNVIFIKRMLEGHEVDHYLKDGELLRAACYYGSDDVVKMLLADSRMQPEADDNAAIRVAATQEYWDIVKLLLADSRVRSKLTKKEIQEYEKMIKED